MTTPSVTDGVPASPELELSLLASAFLSAPADGLAIADTVRAAHFTRPTLGAAWTAIVASWREGNLADPFLVAADACRATGADASHTLSAFLGAITTDVSASWYLRQRAEAVAELALRRELVAFGSDTVREATTTTDVRGLIAYSARYTELLDTMRARDETGTLDVVADEVERDADSGASRGVPTGIADYDAWSGGLRRGEVHVIGGGPGVGKSWCASQIANAVADAGHRVAVFSLEMSAHAMYVRLVAGRIGLIAYRLMGSGRTWAPDEHAAYLRAREELRESGLRLFVRQRSLADISAVVRSYKPAVFLVDYVQLLDSPPGTTPGFEALTENANGLQRLAQVADCTAVVLTQLSREALRGGGTNAYMGGMGSGRIDQVADFGLLVRQGERDGTVELVNRKSRHGVTGGSAVYRLDAARGRLVRA